MCIRVSSDQAVDERRCVLPTSENGRPVWSRVYLCGLHLLGLNRTEYGCLCGFSCVESETLHCKQFDSGECELLHFFG